MSFCAHLESLLAPLSVNTLWVAYSGGVDSLVLLHRLAHADSLRSRYRVRAIHIHHGLSPHANAWSEGCQQTCTDLGIECLVIKVKVDQRKGSSLEAKAREARYQAFSDKLSANDVLLTAHHVDDQAETLLLQLIRGAGPKGLASMPVHSRLGAGHLLRPLLAEERASLEGYARAHGLQWIEDESNHDLRFDRNFLRHHIVPQLRARWPAVATTLARSARHSAEAAELAEAVAVQDYEEVVGRAPFILRLQSLLQLPPVRQKQVLRYVLGQNALPLPDESQLQQVLHDVLRSRFDASPVVAWAGAEVRRYSDEIHCLAPQSPLPSLPCITWSLEGSLTLPRGLGTLVTTQRLEQGISLPGIHPVSVRFRQGGERMHPAGRQGSHPLKKLFQEWNVPPWERARVPLIYYGEELVMVVGYAVAAGWQAEEGEWGVTVTRGLS